MGRCGSGTLACLALALVVAACGDQGRGPDPGYADPDFTAGAGQPPPGSSSSEGAEADEGSSTGGGDEAEESGGESSTGVALPEEPQVAIVAKPAGITGEGGTWTYEDNQVFWEIARSFYAEHRDDYDFLAVYTEGEIPYYGAQALTVAYDVGGIGWDDEPPWVYPDDVGSAGALQQINVMNAPQSYPDPSEASVLVHETAHLWSAFLRLNGTPTLDYLTAYGHWSIHVETGGPSATGYGELLDLGGGRFGFQTAWPLQFSDLELYLAGLIGPEEVGPMFYVASPGAYDPETSVFDGAWSPTSYGEDVEFSGTRVDFSIQDVIAANGPRAPAVGEAQTEFRFAFVLVCADPDACAPGLVEMVEAQRLALPAAFAGATGGRASVVTTL